MRTKVSLLPLLLAAWFLAPSQPAIAQRIEITPTINDPDFGRYNLLFAQQLSNHATGIRIASDLFFTQDVYLAALYACYHEEQWVVATLPHRWWVSQSFARSENYPCTPAFAQWPDGPTQPMTTVMKEYRWTHAGVIYRLEPLPDIPGLPEGVRLFKAVPVQTLPLRQ